MMNEKENALQKNAEEDLQPKVPETVVEDVLVKGELQRSDSPEEAAPDAARTSQTPPVTDNSGETSEPDRLEASTPETDSQEIQETVASPAAPPVPEKKDHAARLAWLKNWAEKQPLFQRSVQYYQGLSSRDQKFILIGLIFLTGILGYTLVLEPMLEKNALINRKIDKKEKDLSDLLALRSSVVQDRGGMDRIKQVVEQRGQGFSMFAYLEQLATKAEMKERIIYIKPQRETPVGTFKESIAEIKLDNASLEELTRFLYQIETSQDLLYVRNLKMKVGRRPQDDAGLEVTLSVGTLLKGNR